MGRAARRKHEPIPAWTPFEKGAFPPALATGERIDAVYLNSRYQVNVERQRSTNPDVPDITVLSIKRRDKEWLRDWRDLQRIKNEILGPEWEAVELFPAESRLVDTSNQYWLWCLPPPLRFPFGMDERIVSEVEVVGPLGNASHQRPFNADQRPADLETVESAAQRLIDAGMRGYVPRRQR